MSSTHAAATTEQDSADGIAAVIALVLLPAAIYVAFFRIDWADQTSPDSLLRYVLPVVFCVIVPSVIANVAAKAITVARER